MPRVADLLEEAERRPLKGWDLSCDGRIAHAAPWDFEAIVDEYLGRSPNLLDLGTGGGEWLSRRPFPKGRTVATEAWPPNVPVAQARLAPLGAAVVAVVGAPDNADQAAASALPALPVAAAAFNLITNRHESFVAAEVARVLAPGGRFLTQQIASDLGAPFRALLGAPPGPPAPPWTLSEALRQVRAAPLEITGCAEGAAVLTFADVGALAWYLIHVPWVMPEFSISRHRKPLEALHEGQAIAVQQPMFWLAARKAG
jgi:SAM-dependent methyltransferase